MRKILQLLNKKRIVKSHKGNNGGFELIKDIREIFLVDIIEVFHGEIKCSEHVFMKEECPHIKICGLKKKIDKIENFVISELKSITLAAVLDTNI